MMHPDVRRLIAFYKSPLGRIARQLVREQIRELAGEVREARILGLGFATPYLRYTLDAAERVIAVMPAMQGASPWPRETASRTVLADPLELPLTDSAVDIVIAVHLLEHVDAAEQMRELWRVCTGGARLIVVVPRRRGLWAQRDNTPFGSGNPFSRSQLDQLLREHSFTPEAWRDALFVPPVNASPVLKSAPLFERGGRLLGSTLAGVMCVRARKELFPAIARRKKVERFVRVPDLQPQTIMEHPPRFY